MEQLTDFFETSPYSFLVVLSVVFLIGLIVFIRKALLNNFYFCSNNKACAIRGERNKKR